MCHGLMLEGYTHLELVFNPVVLLHRLVDVAVLFHVAAGRIEGQRGVELGPVTLDLPRHHP